MRSMSDFSRSLSFRIILPPFKISIPYLTQYRKYYNIFCHFTQLEIEVLKVANRKESISLKIGQKKFQISLPD